MLCRSEGSTLFFYEREREADLWRANVIGIRKAKLVF